MKVNRLEAHDRLQHFQKQEFDIGSCCQDLINQRPFGDHPFYIFAHPRTVGIDEKMRLFSSGKYLSFDQIPEKTIIWQPRLLKPKFETNSMLFKGYPGSDEVKVIWILPMEELWSQYKYGNLLGNKTIVESIEDFKKNRHKLEAPEDDDPSPEEVQRILFEYQPQLFKRETLPPELRSIWDMKMAARKKTRPVS